jgi:hypothetical protein
MGTRKDLLGSAAERRREKMRQYKRDATEAKNILMRLEMNISSVSVRESKKLCTIIARLEAWQNA